MVNFLLIILLSSVALVHSAEHTTSSEEKTAETASRQARQFPAIWPFSSHGQYYRDSWYPYYSFDSDALPQYSSYEFDEESQGRMPSPKPSYMPIDDFYGDEQRTFRQRPFSLTNINSVNSNTIIPNRVRPRIQSCTDVNGFKGVCVRNLACTANGGRPSGGCGLGRTCCVNAVNRCGTQVTLNNTYWQSPSVVSSESSCSLTVTLDRNLAQQWQRPICQLRLDFLAFSIAQPAASSQCLTDAFVVGGATNSVPVICGDNAGQHMYLDLPTPTTDVHLLFTFAQSTFVRSWNILVSMIQCGSPNLAPQGCLQYFRQPSGSIQSFNWADTNPVATRQLANQDYSICFRNEALNNLDALRVCFTPCSVTNGGSSFSLSTPGAGTGPSLINSGSCANDFLVIQDGRDSVNQGLIADRFCGQQLNAVANLAAAASVCTTVNNFRLLYRTNANENGDANNVGFCLTFQERSN